MESARETGPDKCTIWYGSALHPPSTYIRLDVCLNYRLMLFLLLLLMVLLSHFFFPFFYLFLSFSECFLQNKLNSLSPFAACSFFSHFLLYSFFRSFDEMHPCSSNTIEPPGLYILFKSSIRDFFGQAEGACSRGREKKRTARGETRNAANRSDKER